MSVYADSSFFGSLYLQDANSHEAWRRMSSHPRLWLTPLNRVELAHAVAQGVFRDVISNDEARLIYLEFDIDRGRGLWVQVPMPDNAFDTCVRLAQQYVPQIGVRTLDTLHVACALELGAERFFTFDERQVKLARAVGLKA